MAHIPVARKYGILHSINKLATDLCLYIYLYLIDSSESLFVYFYIICNVNFGKYVLHKPSYLVTLVWFRM